MLTAVPIRVHKNRESKLETFLQTWSCRHRDHDCPDFMIWRVVVHQRGIVEQFLDVFVGAHGQICFSPFGERQHLFHNRGQGNLRPVRGPPLFSPRCPVPAVPTVQSSCRTYSSAVPDWTNTESWLALGECFSFADLGNQFLANLYWLVSDIYQKSSLFFHVARA